MSQNFLVYFYLNTWNQPFLEEALFLFIGSGILRSESGPGDANYYWVGNCFCVFNAQRYEIFIISCDLITILPIQI